MVNFNHLYYFHVTASEGSVKAAADRLGVTQPTVSEQLRILERTLGVRLFERTPTGIRLTQLGRDAFEHTTAMFLASQRLLAALGDMGEIRKVMLRVGVSAAVSRILAIDFLLPVLTLEQCRPSIRIADFNDLLRDLRTRELDLVLGEAEPIAISARGMEVVPIFRPSLVAVAHPEVEPSDDWQELSLLEYRASSLYHWEVEGFLKERSLRPKSAGELDDAHLMLEAVMRAQFVAFVPYGVAREALSRGRVKLLAKLPLPDSAVHAIYPESDTLDLARAAVERLVASAREQLDDA